MVTMAQSAANWRQHTLTHVDRTHSLTRYVNTVSYNHIGRSASSAITYFGIELLFLTVREGGRGEQTRSSRRKPPDNVEHCVEPF